MFWVYSYKGFFTHGGAHRPHRAGTGRAAGLLSGRHRPSAAGAGADGTRQCSRLPAPQAGHHHSAGQLQCRPGRGRTAQAAPLRPCTGAAQGDGVCCAGAHAASAARAENEHLLCAMLEDSTCTASRWMLSLGVELPQAARECRQLSGQLVLPAQPRMAASRTGRPSEKYGRDLTRLAQEGRLDPVLCRDSELERMVEILCRRQKNNPCLLGEPGVGKSALAEALAQRIASGQITPACGANGSYRSIWPRWWRARNTAVISRSALKTCLRSFTATARPSCSLMRSTSLPVPGQRRGLSMPPAS